jgi:hypothetical protein
MTMPGKKSILVEGKTYPYVIKFGSSHINGETSKVIKLTFRLDSKKYVSARFESKLWTQDHEDNIDSAPIHKNSFTPKDVAAVIKGLVCGELPPDFELDTWRLTKDHQRVR